MNKHYRAIAGARAAAETNRAYPLRKIVGTVFVPLSSLPDITVPHELYECGHHATAKSDLFGPTNAVRRRCRQCPQKEESADG